MRGWLVLGVLATVGVMAFTAGCRRPWKKQKTYSTTRVVEPRTTGSSSGRSARTAGYETASRGTERVVSRSWRPGDSSPPPVTAADWERPLGSADVAWASPVSARTVPTDNDAARRRVMASATGELAAAGPAYLPSTGSSLPTGSGWAAAPLPATDAKLLNARQLMGMAPPALSEGVAVPRTEMIYASAGAVPAALRRPSRDASGTQARPLPRPGISPAPDLRWSHPLPELETERVFTMPVAKTERVVPPLAAAERATPADGFRL